jgi:uncharacterized membrane protein YsdA (DUF1294 family)
MPTLTPTLILCTLILLNAWTFMLFGIDKLRAEAGTWRIAESTLLGFAFFGGSIGAFFGRRVFRHKTRKEPFSTELRRIAFLHAVAAAAGTGWILA